jgi:hypothetical protein
METLDGVGGGAVCGDGDWMRRGWIGKVATGFHVTSNYSDTCTFTYISYFCSESLWAPLQVLLSLFTGNCCDQKRTATMKKSMSQRRVPRKIRADDDEDERMSSGADTGSETTGQYTIDLQFPRRTSLTFPFHSLWPRLTSQRTESLIKRPNKPRKSTNLRKSIIHNDDDDPGDLDSASVVTPKRSNLTKIAVQRNASKQRSSFLPSDLPSDSDNNAPSYSAADLQALKNSTPSTPQQLQSTGASDVEDVSATTQALDLNSKFGSSLSRYQQQQSLPSAIPSATEISEKKARRARLAAETRADEFISLDPDEPGFDEDSDGNVATDETGRLILRPKDKYGLAESRLVREDEDVLEGFDEFTGETGARIHMDESTRGGERQRRKEEMAAQIAAAEAEEDSEDGDESERERNMAFEAAQTRHGNFSTAREDDEEARNGRPKTPPKIAPLPSLDGVIGRLRAQLAGMQTARMEKVGEMAALEREKIRIGEEEVRIQKALRETGEKFEALRKEKGIASTTASGLVTKEGTPALLDSGRGLGFGGNGAAEEDDEEDERPALGLGMPGRGLETLGTSGVGTPVQGSSDRAMDD